MANFGKDRTSKLEGQVANLEANQAQVMAMMGQLKAAIERLGRGTEETKGEKEKESVEKTDMKDAEFGSTDIR